MGPCTANARRRTVDSRCRGGQRMSGAVLPAGVQGAEPLLEAFRPPPVAGVLLHSV